MAYMYRHIRLDKNEPFYIGISKKEDKYRRSHHKEDRNNLWKKIVQKTEYRVEIIFENDDIEFIKQKEMEFIALYGRINLGTGTLANLTDGGDGVIGYVYTKEQNEANRQRNLEWCKDPKRKEFIKNINKGRKVSEEHREKNRLSSTGRICKDSTKKLLSQLKTGKKFNQDFKNKISQNKSIFLYDIEHENIIYKDIRYLSNFCKDHNLNVSALQKTFIGLDSNGLSFNKHKDYKIIKRNVLEEFKDSKLYNNMINTENKRLNKYLNREVKQYTICNINTSETFLITNLTNFCIDNKLDLSSLIKTEKGFNSKGKSYNNVKGFKIISKTIIKLKDA